MELMRQRRGAGKFLVYFQTFTNTYGDLGTLKHLYDEAVQFPEVVGLIVGTRPDCVSGWVLDLLGSYIPRLQVWMEYGLQSMHNNTLRFLKRGHTFEDYLEAVRQTYDRNIPVCSHIILGLPGESREMMLQTAGTLCIPGVKAVKIHPLQVVRGTELEEMYARGEVSTLSLDRYLELVCDVLELLPSDLIIQRLTAESALDLLIAPRWGVGKAAVLHLIDETLRKRGTFQGTYYREGKTGPSHRKESD